MKALPESFNESGYNYSLVERRADVALFQYGRNGKIYGFEVVRVRKYLDRVIMGNPSPATEAMPPASAWGEEGWSYSVHNGDTEKARAKALDKLASEFEREPSTPTRGEPTGKARGRARNEFELDLDFTIDKPECKFLFADVAAQYPETDEPMLRNRLKAMVDGGTVLVVGTITGGKGRPKNIYQLA